MRPVTFSTEVWSDGLDEDWVAELGADEEFRSPCFVVSVPSKAPGRFSTASEPRAWSACQFGSLRVARIAVCVCRQAASAVIPRRYSIVRTAR